MIRLNNPIESDKEMFATESVFRLELKTIDNHYLSLTESNNSKNNFPSRTDWINEKNDKPVAESIFQFSLPVGALGSISEFAYFTAKYFAVNLAKYVATSKELNPPEFILLIAQEKNDRTRNDSFERSNMQSGIDRFEQHERNDKFNGKDTKFV